MTVAAYLTGKLLVATPNITDQMFRRSVVLMLHHDEAGAHGLVLNKPIGVDVDALLPGWSAHLSDPAVLFQGGPVGLDTAFGLAWAPADPPGVGIERVFGTIGVVDLDCPPEQVSVGSAGLRIFVGYAGWGAGQLEGEIEEGMWHVVDAEAGDVFGDQPLELWRTVLRRQRGSLALFSTWVEDPAQN